MLAIRKTFRPAVPAAAGLIFFLNAACVFAAFDQASYAHKEEFSKTLPLAADGSFSLKNTNGIVRVSTWDKPEVEIKAEKSASRESVLAEVKIEVSADPGSVVVDTIYPRRPFLRAKVVYDVRVPAGVRIESVRTTNGNVELTGRFAGVKAGTTNGTVRLDKVDGELDVSTTNGSIRAQDVVGRVKARTTNGGITLGLGGVKDEIEASTTNGSITLRVQGAFNADLTARTTNGRVNTDFPITVQGTVGSRRRLEGRIGEGGPKIDLRTTNGSIHITK